MLKQDVCWWRRKRLLHMGCQITKVNIRLKGLEKRETKCTAEAPADPGMTLAHHMAHHTTRFGSITKVLQCLRHMRRLLPKFRTFAVLSAVFEANSTWGMCSRHCNTSKADAEVLQQLKMHQDAAKQGGGPQQASLLTAQLKAPSILLSIMCAMSHMYHTDDNTASFLVFLPVCCHLL